MGVASRVCAGATLIPRVFAALYLLPLAAVLYIRPWTLALLLDLCFLLAYLVLCHRRGVSALAGEGQSQRVFDTLLWVVPLALVLACHFVSVPRPLPLLASLAAVPLLALVSLLWRGRRQRGSRVEGALLLVAPLASASLLAWLFRGSAGGIYLVLTNWLEYAFAYAGVGSLWALALGAGAALLGLGAARLRFGPSLPEAVFGAGVGLYLVGGYLLFVVYYDPPLAHTAEQVAAQPHTDALPFPSERGPGRTLWVDPAEQQLLLSVKSTFMGADSEASGLSSYDLVAQRERHFVPIAAPCIEMVVDPESGRVYSCEFFSRTLRTYDLATLALSDERVLPAPLRPEAWLRQDERYDVIRFEVPGSGPPLARLDRETGELTPIHVPRRTGVVGSYAIAFDRGRKKIYLPMGGSDLTVLNRLDWEGRFEASVDLHGISFEAHYSAVHDAVFVALLNRDRLYRVDPETLTYEVSSVPRGARAVRESAHGTLILGDYLRGKLYLYDPTRRALLATLLVGAKPQAVTVASGSGNLYVHSSFGLTRFALPQILEGLR